ncbi:MAG: hypothetical protein HOP29_08770 [Phycisphaerales bacterium]|nr:hypothetical protein [Phycisphaerales bacterium]
MATTAIDHAPAHTLEPIDVQLGPGRIIFITGPSGSGKSTALRSIESRCPAALNVERVRFPEERSVVDGVCPGRPLTDALSTLSACGLSESPLWLRRPDELSDGQRFRARLARAVGLIARTNSSGPLLCDEFCSGLHRRLARSIAFNLRKLATRRGWCLVLASSDDDFAADLQPDITVRLSERGKAQVVESSPRRRPFSLARRAVIAPGRKADYDAFAAMHYRATDELGFVDSVFVLRDGPDGDVLAIVVYAHGPMELALRNQATHGRFVKNPDRLNRNVRILRRLVVHPDVRGCGLGHWLVRRTMPLVGTRYVECLASMGEINPVFEKSGMTRIGTCTLPDAPARAVEHLNALGVDPFALDFADHVARRPRVRRIVAHAVYRWYQATTGGGDRRVVRQSAAFLAQTFRGIVGSRPVYYLWERPSCARRAARVRHDSTPRPSRRRQEQTPTSPDRKPRTQNNRDRRTPARNEQDETN